MMIRYRMLFLSRKTFLTAAVGVFLLMPVSLILNALSGQMTVFNAASIVLNILLCAGLSVAWQRDDLIRVSGLVAGILLTELCRYTYYTEQYLSLQIDGIVALGLTACMALSACLMVCFIILMITFDHFTINPERNSGRTKLIANQLSISVLLLCLLFLTIESWLIGDSNLLQKIGNATGCLGDLCLFIDVACCELYLAVDGRILSIHRKEK